MACEARRFTRGAGLVLLAMLGWIAGCDNQEAGNVLRQNFGAEPQTLNPLTSRDYYATVVQGWIFEPLIERDLDTLQWRGVLAEKWTVSEDGRTVTFHLDPRAKFSDGQPVTADDVVFAFDQIRNPEIDCAQSASYYEDCEKCEKVDDRTVRFLWRKVYYKSLEVSGSTQVLPKHVYGGMTPKTFNDVVKEPLVGTGTYVLKRWTTGQSIVLERNPNYWRQPLAFDKIVYRIIQEEQPQVQAFLSGELDDLPVTPEWWEKLKARDDAGKAFMMYRYNVPGGGYTYIAWNNARPLFSDKRVRRAMTMLINREELVARLMKGIGTVTSGPFWIKSPQYDASIQPWPYDPAAAKALLKESGWEDRNGDGWLDNAQGEKFAFEFTAVAGAQLGRDIVRLAGEGFRTAGIDMNTRFIEWSVFTTKLDNRDYDAIMLGWTGAIEDDPYQIWHSSQVPNRGSNHVGFKNAEADRLIEEARVTLDTEKRNALYHQFHRILHEEQPYTFMWARDSLHVIASRVRNVTVHKLGLDDREWTLDPGAPAQQGTPAP
jgi:peptide/nickel transport system substrate-binding protein